MPLLVRSLLVLLVPLQDDARPVAELARLPAGVPPPVVDARLDDPAWAYASRLGPLRQVEPVAGAAPSEPTEVLLLHDADALHVALVCRDADPDGIRATQMQRDARLDPDDRVELWIDTFLDRRNAYWFQIGPAGSKGDGLIARNGASFDKDFDAIWYGRARVTDEGWVAELTIPARSLNLDPGAEAFGFNLRRFVRRRSEEARWASPDPRHRFFDVSRGGTLVGVGPLDQGLGLDVVPFVVAERLDRDGDVDGDLDAGLDLFWRPRPDAKLSLSLNTDFAETEVDERRVNLTRFPLFFPEKRDFFLEDAGAFSFGADGIGREEVVPFFSRRIGLDADGEEVPLLVAAKLTAATETATVGALVSRTGEEGELDAQTLGVARASLAVLEQSDAGVIVTAGDPLDEGREATVGADLNLRTDEFAGDRNLRLSAWALGTEGEDGDADGLAWHVGAGYPNDEVELAAEYTLVERSFDPALGFVRRRDAKTYEALAAWRPRLYTSVRRLLLEVRPRLVTDVGNRTETVEVEVQPLGVEWESGEEAAVVLTHAREVVDEPFDLEDEATVDAGSYTFDRAGAFLETSEKRPLALELGVETGGFFGGHRDDLEAALDWRPSRHVLLGLEYERNDVSLPGGDLDVDLARLRLDLVASPELSWSGLVQYDDVSKELGLNARLRWILRPGREVNLVVTQGWEWDPPHLGPESSQVAAKLSYTLRP